MANLYDAFLKALGNDEEIYRDDWLDEVMSSSNIENILRYGDVIGNRFFADNKGNVWEAKPTDNYDPAVDLPLDELEIDDDERKAIEDGTFDEEYRLAELEEKCGIWNNPEKFTHEAAYTRLGYMYEYFLKRAKEKFKKGDIVTQEDIENLSEGDFDITLDDDEYDAIAVAATGNHLVQD